MSNLESSSRLYQVMNTKDGWQHDCVCVCGLRKSQKVFPPNKSPKAGNAAQAEHSTLLSSLGHFRFQSFVEMMSLATDINTAL